MHRLRDYREYVRSVVMVAGAGAVGSTEGKLQNQVDREINSAVNTLLGYRDWLFLQRVGGGRTWSDYTTGTITLNEGSPIIDGAGTAWTKAYQGGLLEVTPAGGSLFRHRVREVSAGGTIEVEAPWTLATEADLTYVLSQDRYYLRHDCDVGGILEESVRLYGVSHPLRNITRQELNYYMGSAGAQSTGEWPRWIDDAHSEVELWNTGSVDVVAGSMQLDENADTDWENVLLNHTVLGDVLVGAPVMILTPSESAPNGVRRVIDGTEIQMDVGFGGATLTAQSYRFGPVQSPMIQFWPPPSVGAPFSYLYTLSFPGMFAADDASPIPKRWKHVVEELAASRALLQYKGGEAVQKQAQAHYRRYKEARDDMAAQDHPNDDVIGYMRDHALVWDLYGGYYRHPEHTAPNYWRARG